MKEAGGAPQPRSPPINKQAKRKRGARRRGGCFFKWGGGQQNLVPTFLHTQAIFLAFGGKP